MSETRDLIGIYGAVGRAAEERGEQVRRFVPAFSKPDAHWIDAFTEWTDERREDSSEDAFPGLDEALKNLAGRKVRGPEAARRIFALGAAVRAHPEVGDPTSPRGKRAVRALIKTGLADRANGPELLAAIASDAPFDDPEAKLGEALDAWWANIALVVTGDADIAVVDVMGPRPCAGGLVRIDVPGEGPYAAALTTSFTTDKVPFERAIEFLAPVNWPKCHNFWCEMVKLGVRPSGKHHYREVVSTDCGNRAASWTVAVDLDFTFHKTADRALTTYELAEGHPTTGDEVRVNEGTLIVERDNGGVAVTTTKRLLFAREEPSPEVLATVLCLVGYGSAVEDLVFSCAMDPGRAGTEFPASEDEEQPDQGAAAAGSTIIDAVATRCTLTLRRCLDRGSQKAAESRVLMRDGKYGADALARDAVDLIVHSLKEATEGLRGGIHESRGAATAERARHRAARGGP